jgi:predicted nucleotidyltransferase
MEDDQSFEAIGKTLKRASAALREAGVPFLLGGSLASWARGGPETRHDLDLMLKPEDAEQALRLLTELGMRPERPPEAWLYKAWDGDVLVDLIFGPKDLAMTDEVIARGDELDVFGMDIRVMAIEDVVATKLLALDEHSLDYSTLLQIVRALREQIDWDAVRRRTHGSPYAQAFFVLVRELGISDPGAAGEPHPGAHSRVRVVS